MEAPFADWAVRCQEERSNIVDSELLVLQAYIEGNFLIEEALATLTMPTRPIPCSHQENRLWDMVFSAAIYCPQAHAALISLLESIFALPPPSSSQEIDWPEACSFSFRITSSEDLKCLYREHSVNPLSDPVHIKWINFNAFEAHLISSSLLLSSYGHALNQIIHGLGKGIDLGNVSPRDESDIQSAAQYFIIAAKSIIGMPNDITADERNTTSEGGGSSLWKGQRFSMDLWHSWKSRLEQIRESNQLLEQIREDARAAVVAMDKAERQPRKRNR